jgi:hypothetical protein
MKTKILPVLAILMLFSLMLVSCDRLNPTTKSDSVSNSDLINFKDFSLSAESVNLNSSVQGTVFVEGDIEKSKDRHVTICARVEIDPEDWGGLGIYIEQTEWNITNFTSNYPEGNPEPDAWAQIWTKTVEDGSEKMITIGRSDNPPESSGGGVGTVIIELDPASGAEDIPENLEFSIGIGSKDGYIVNPVGEDIVVPINDDYRGISAT